MTFMPTLLTNIELDEISLVDEPANKGARVVFWKRNMTSAERKAMLDKMTPGEKGKYLAMSESEKRACEEKMSKRDAQTTKISKLADVLSTAFAKAGIDVESEGLTSEELIGLLKALGDDGGEVEKPAEDKAPEKTDPPAEDKAPEKTDPPADVDKSKTKEPDLAAKDQQIADLTKRLGDLEGKIAKAAQTEDRLAKAEGELAGMRRRDKLVKAAADLESEGVADAMAVAEMLDSMPDEPAKKMRERIVADAQVIKSSALFAPIGHAGHDSAPNSADAEIEKLAKRKAAKDGVSYETAYADIWKTDVQLRKRVESEQQLAKRRAN